MKYFKEYIEERDKTIYGELEEDEFDPIMGYKFRIKGQLYSLITVTPDEYINWLEKKYDLLKKKLDLLNNDEKNKM